MKELSKLYVKRKELAEILFGFTLTNVLKEVFKIIKGIDIISSSCCIERLA